MYTSEYTRAHSLSDIYHSYCMHINCALGFVFFKSYFIIFVFASHTVVNVHRLVGHVELHELDIVFESNKENHRPKWTKKIKDLIIDIIIIDRMVKIGEKITGTVTIIIKKVLLPVQVVPAIQMTKRSEHLKRNIQSATAHLRRCWKLKMIQS